MQLSGSDPFFFSAFVLGHAVSDSGLIVGFDHDGMDNDFCRWRAVIWDDGPQMPPQELPLVESGASQREMALDIRVTQGDGSIDVVGRNVTEGKAVLWQFDGTSTWSVVDISGVDPPAPDVIDDLRNFNKLNCATGINENGCISVWGEQGVDPIYYRSGILIPYDYYQSDVCPGDLVSSTGTQHPDGRIDVHDLFALLAGFGDDEIGAILAPPYDIVNTSDLFVLLANWNCRIGDTGPAGTLEEEVIAAGLSMDDWDDFVYVMQYSEDENEKSNYKCWMMNYLSGCSVCPPCIGNDPYDPR